MRKSENDLTEKRDFFLSEGKCEPHVWLAPEHMPVVKSKSSSKSAARRQASWEENLFLFLCVVTKCACM